MTRASIPAAVALVAGLLAGCTYDPPPRVASSVPKNASVIGDYAASIEIVLTEPIQPESLAVTLSVRRLGREGELLPFCEIGQETECARLIAGECRPAGECPGASLTLLPNARGFVLDPQEELTIGELVLRIAAGLRDLQGNETGVPLDVRFFVSPTGDLKPTTFAPGTLFTLMDLKQPFEFPFEVYWFTRVEPETGRVFGGGCDGDLIDPDGERILNPTVWQPETNLEGGFKFLFEGIVQDVELTDAQGVRRSGYYLETYPFYIYCNQPQVEVIGGHISVTIVYDEESGRDLINGSMRSDEAYLFDTPAHANPYKAVGDVRGMRMYAAEVLEGVEWTGCESLDPATVTLPP